MIIFTRGRYHLSGYKKNCPEAEYRSSGTVTSPQGHRHNEGAAERDGVEEQDDYRESPKSVLSNPRPAGRMRPAD